MLRYRVYFCRKSAAHRSLFVFPSFEEAKSFIDRLIAEDDITYVHLHVTYKNKF